MKREKGIYLDNAATTLLSEDMKDYLKSLLDIYGNPSSSHSVGDKAHNLLIEARKSVAKFINADFDDVYFTPSGSASNTLAIRHFGGFHSCPIIYSPLCHKSVKKAVEDSQIYSELISVDSEGRIDLVKFREIMEWYKHIPDVPLVVISYADSEVGTVQDVFTLIEITHDVGGYIYVDCTGSIPYIPINVKEWDFDMLGFSGHKLGALKGCGVFYKKPNLTLSPLIYGAQEQGLIGGTENVLGILSLGYAVSNYDYFKHLTNKNQVYLWKRIREEIEDCYSIGDAQSRLPNNLFICFKGLKGTHIQVSMDELFNIQISTGSACNNYNPEAPMSLKAMGIPEEDWFSCIRITLNNQETQEELDYVVDSLKYVVDLLRRSND